MDVIQKTVVLDVGFNVPAEIGMALEDVSTPALIVDLDALEKTRLAHSLSAKTSFLPVRRSCDQYVISVIRTCCCR